MLDIRKIASLVKGYLPKLADLHSSEVILDEVKEALRCPRCGTQLESVGTRAGLPVVFVVPPICVLKCPQCGYEERSWV